MKTWVVKWGEFYLELTDRKRHLSVPGGTSRKGATRFSSLREASLVAEHAREWDPRLMVRVLRLTKPTNAGTIEALTKFRERVDRQRTKGDPLEMLRALIANIEIVVAGLKREEVGWETKSVEARVLPNDGAGASAAARPRTRRR